MKLGVREAARMLAVSETKIYRWIDQREIPHVMIQHRPMLHRIELLEWAMEMALPIRADLYDDDDDEHLLSAALQRGGGHVLAGALDTIAADLTITTPADRDVIRAVIAARDHAMFVARRADGIAVPHARSPIICAGAPPLVMLCWCAPDALVLDGAPVQVVVLVVAPTSRIHLKLLSRLAGALHDPDVRAAVLRRDGFAQVVAEVSRFEHRLAATRNEAP